MRTTKKSHYVLSGVLAIVAAFPLATDLALPSGGFDLGASLLTEVQQKAKGNQDENNEKRRLVREIQKVCRERSATNPEVRCPDVNDSKAVTLFLRSGKVVEVHSAATDSGSTVKTLLPMDELSDKQRLMLRRFQRAGTCPEGLRDYTAGFYELCVESLKHTKPRVRDANARTVQPDLQQKETLKGSSTMAEPSKRPGR